MQDSKADILERLRREILPLQGFRNCGQITGRIDLGPINTAFHDGIFPTGAIHELLADSPENLAASIGFTMGIVSRIAGNSGVTIWIGSSINIFPPALLFYGIDPAKVIFIETKKEQDCLWAAEEALKCEGLSAVVFETAQFGFTASRRFQLAVEQSRVTGFALRRNIRNPGTTTSITRWKIEPMASVLQDQMPGVGFPRWKVELLKLRNGKPASWEIEYRQDKFHQVSHLRLMQQHRHKKTG